MPSHKALHAKEKGNSSSDEKVDQYKAYEYPGGIFNHTVFSEKLSERVSENAHLFCKNTVDS